MYSTNVHTYHHLYGVLDVLESSTEPQSTKCEKNIRKKVQISLPTFIFYKLFTNVAIIFNFLTYFTLSK